MKSAAAQFPVIGQLASKAEARPIVVSVSHQKLHLLGTLAIVGVFGAGMMYGLLTYGRLFQNYTQW